MASKLNRLKRFFRYKNVDVNGLNAVRDSLQNLSFSSWNYTLFYPSEEVVCSRFEEVKDIVATKGVTRRCKLDARSDGGRTVCFDASNSSFISVDFFCGPRHVDSEEVVDKVQGALDLVRLKRIVDRVFVAHGFDTVGKAYAAEARLFFEALGVKVETGEYFEPGSIPKKVKERIENCDMFLAIVSPQDDQTWITQEILHADTIGNQPIVLVDRTANYKPGMLGDSEYIPFSSGCLSEGFVKILQGMNKLRGAT